jgi:ribose transport system permease protein
VSSAAPAAVMGGESLRASLARLLRRNAWVAGLWVVLVLLLAGTKVIQPDYGPSGITALALAALPFAFATAGQTVAIIGGGLDLSIAAMMALVSVIAATLMDGQAEEFGLLAVPIILLLGMGLGAINGLTIVLTRIPDIVVTLAFYFIWEGAALLVLDTPGGDASGWLKQLVLGTVGAPGISTELTQWVPKALLLLILALALVWLALSRSRLGLWIYAIGSNRQAAFRSGVPVDRTKIASYAITGLFAAMGGLILVMLTGNGNPIQGPYLLASVAAVVLGGVSLAGGRGSLVGPILAIFILRLVRQDLVFLSVDPNVAQVVEGAIMVGLVLIGSVTAMRGLRGRRA